MTIYTDLPVKEISAPDKGRAASRLPKGTEIFIGGIQLPREGDDEYEVELVAYLWQDKLCKLVITKCRYSNHPDSESYTMRSGTPPSGEKDEDELKLYIPVKQQLSVIDDNTCVRNTITLSLSAYCDHERFVWDGCVKWLVEEFGNVLHNDPAWFVCKPLC